MSKLTNFNLLSRDNQMPKKLSNDTMGEHLIDSKRAIFLKNQMQIGTNDNQMPKKLSNDTMGEQLIDSKKAVLFENQMKISTNSEIYKIHQETIAIW